MRRLLEVAAIVDNDVRVELFKQFGIIESRTIDFDYLESNNCPNHLMESLMKYDATLGSSSYGILNYKMKCNLGIANLAILNTYPVFKDIVVNHHGLPMHVARRILSEATTVGYQTDADRTLLSGLYFSYQDEFNHVEFGHGINQLMKDYLVSKKMDYQVPVNPSLEKTVEYPCLPYVDQLIVAINDLVEGDILNYLLQANGAGLVVKLAACLEADEIYHLESLISELAVINRIYANGQSVDQDALRTLTNDIDIILVSGWHTKMNMETAGRRR